MPNRRRTTGNVAVAHAMHKAFNRRYADFYLDNGMDDAEEAIDQVLQAFSQPSSVL